jgi:hypothetical protein
MLLDTAFLYGWLLGMYEVADCMLGTCRDNEIEIAAAECVFLCCGCNKETYFVLKQRNRGPIPCGGKLFYLFTTESRQAVAYPTS